MNGWLRRFRAAVGMGLTWAAGWAPIGAVVGAVLHFIVPAGGVGLGAAVVLNGSVFATLGFMGGAGFAKALYFLEGRHSFDELSLPRLTAWGAAGGLVLGTLATVAGLWGAGIGVGGAVVAGAATLLGAASAARTLTLARSAGRKTLPAEDDPPPAISPR